MTPQNESTAARKLILSASSSDRGAGEPKRKYDPASFSATFGDLQPSAQSASSVDPI
jgi:hypothetical protein